MEWLYCYILSFISSICNCCRLKLLLSKRECEGRYEIVQVLKERRIDKIGERLHELIFPRIERRDVYFVISVYVYLATNSEFALGKYSLVNSAVSFVCYYLVARMLKKEWRKSNFTWGHYFICCRLLVIFNVTYTKLLIYAACIAIAYPILLVPYGSMTYDVIGRAKMRENGVWNMSLFGSYG